MKLYRPTSPGRRGMTDVDRSALARKRPEKRLSSGKRRTGGRNCYGCLTSRSRGGGHRKLLRDIVFGQEKLNVPGIVETLEYDPNRSAFIALVLYRDGDRRYLLAPQGLGKGQRVFTAPKTPLKTGNRLVLKNIPVGMQVYNIELFPGKGGQIVRAAGSSAQILAHEGGFAHVLLPSREIRRIHEGAFASLGVVSNPEWSSVTFGKAGRSRWHGRRPHVRGTAMNPVDHPHGGGEGRSPIGLKHPKTPWGKPALGVKTRNKKKPSGIFILQRRQKRR